MIFKEKINLIKIWLHDIFNYLKQKLLHIYKKLYKHKHNKKIKILFYICLLIISSFSVFFNSYRFNSKYYQSKNSFSMYVKVYRLESVKSDKISYIVNLKEKTKDKYSDKFVLNIYKDKYSKTDTDLSQYSNYVYGDILVLNGKINIPKLLGNPGEFNYKRYLNSNGIYGTITTYSVKNVDNKADNFILNYIYKFKNYLNDRIDKKIPEAEANLLKSMVYGDDSKLDEEIKNDFTEIGISHLIAVSGSNISNVVLIIYLVSSLFNIKRVNKLIFSIIFILIFCVFTNFELSLVRATIMSIAFLITNYINERSDRKNIGINKYKILIFSFVLIFIYNPYCVYNIGFQFSYASTVGIIIFFSRINSFFDVILKKILNISSIYKEANKIKLILKKLTYYILKYIFILLSLTVSCQILTLPIQIVYFNTFSIATFLSNILVASISSVQQILGLFSVAFIHFEFISDILLNANFVLLRVVILIAKNIEKLNLPKLDIPTPNNLIIYFYYSIIFFIFIKEHLQKKLKKFNIALNIKLIKRFNIRIYRDRLINIIDYLFILKFILVISWYLYTMYFENYIYYFNVGQGNMAFIRYNHKNIIVDCGSTESNLAGNIMVNFLRSKAIKNIDLVCITHFHNDHVNGYEKITQNANIGHVVYSIPKLSNVSEYDNFEKITNNNNISSVQIDLNDNIRLNSNISIDILSPSNEVIKSSDVMNSNSNTFLININNKNYLFMGDSTKETEDFLISNFKNHFSDKNKKIEILQVGHHGSSTSSSEKFLKYFDIKNGVISAKKEKYGHPSQVTLDILNKYNINIQITEIRGTIKYII